MVKFYQNMKFLTPTLKNCFSGVTVLFLTWSCWKRCQNARGINSIIWAVQRKGESNTLFLFSVQWYIQGAIKTMQFFDHLVYDGAWMKIINFGMHGWVMGKATSVSEAHPFTMNLFDVYCRGEIVNDHSHRFLFVSPCIIIVPPCIG